MRLFSRVSLGVLSVWLLFFPVLSYAYTPTQADDQLLDSVFTRMETLYLHNTPKLLAFYEALPTVSAKYRVKPQNAYLLDRIEKYIKLLLFTSVYEDRFVCLPEYVQESDTVTVNYSLTELDGTIIDTTREQHDDPANEVVITAMPVVFNAGKGQIIEWFDEEVLGMKAAEFNSFMLTPKNWFGDWNPLLVKLVSRQWLERKVWALNEWEDYTVTMTLMEDGEAVVSLWRIIDMNSEVVTIDFNHPYAGQSLLWSLKVETYFKACNTNDYPMHTTNTTSLSSDDRSWAIMLWRTTLK